MDNKKLKKFTLEGEDVNTLKRELTIYNRSKFLFKSGLILIIIGVIIGFLDISFSELLLINEYITAGIIFGFPILGALIAVCSYRSLVISKKYIQDETVYCLSCGQYVGDGFHTQERCDKCDSNRLTLEDPLVDKSTTTREPLSN